MPEPMQLLNCSRQENSSRDDSENWSMACFLFWPIYSLQFGQMKNKQTYNILDIALSDDRCTAQSNCDTSAVTPSWLPAATATCAKMTNIQPEVVNYESLKSTLADRQVCVITIPSFRTEAWGCLSQVPLRCSQIACLHTSEYVHRLPQYTLR